MLKTVAHVFQIGLVVVLLAACGKDKMNTTPIPSLEGNWLLSSEEKKNDDGSITELDSRGKKEVTTLKNGKSLTMNPNRAVGEKGEYTMKDGKLIYTGDVVPHEFTIDRLSEDTLILKSVETGLKLRFSRVSDEARAAIIAPVPAI